jgi:hypothetical protein
MAIATQPPCKLASAADPMDHCPGERSVEMSWLPSCLSRLRNARVVAGLLQLMSTADMFELRPDHSYPREYLATVAAVAR